MAEIASDPNDFVRVVEVLTNFIENERIRHYNEGVDAERARCARIADNHAGAQCTGMKGKTERERQTAASRLTSQSIAAEIRNFE